MLPRLWSHCAGAVQLGATSADVAHADAAEALAALAGHAGFADAPASDDDGEIPFRPRHLLPAHAAPSRPAAASSGVGLAQHPAQLLELWLPVCSPQLAEPGVQTAVPRLECAD